MGGVIAPYRGAGLDISADSLSASPASLLSSREKGFSELAAARLLQGITDPSKTPWHTQMCQGNTRKISA